MQTLAQWLEQNPGASAVPSRAGQVAGQWIRLNGSDASGLPHLSDYKLAHSGSDVVLLKPKVAKYGGAIPAQELDLPSKLEADRLIVSAALNEDEETREVQIAQEILNELSAGDRQLPETTFANIRRLAQELQQLHRGKFADLSAPSSNWGDDSPHAGSYSK